MPHIDGAMRASLRRSVVELVYDTLQARQGAPDASTAADALNKVNEAANGIGKVANGVNNAKTTFSSWDNCMAKSYCKWPVILGIIVVSLIALSIITCVVRCMCLGYSCCCSCFSCLKCCQCCGSCCDGKRSRPRHNDMDGRTPLHAGYAHMPMMTSAAGGPPQYAQFEVGKNGLAVAKPVSEDALPPMPSWDTAAKRHVEIDEEKKEDVELGDLDPATGQKVPLVSAANTAPASPAPEKTSVYGAASVPGSQTGGFGGNAAYRGTPGATPRGYNQQGGSPAMGNARYDSPSQASDYFGAGAMAARPAMHNQSSHAGHGSYYSPQQPQYPPNPSRQYSGSTYGGNGYANAPQQRPGYNDRGYTDHTTYSGAPSYNSSMHANAQPAAQHSYPSSQPPPHRMPSPAQPTQQRMLSPPQATGNMGGFDFGLPDANSAPTPVSHPSQPAQSHAAAAPYPGYRAWQPSRPEAGADRQGPSWDPTR